MHITDGVLSMPVVVMTTVGAAGLIVYAIKGMKEEEIPKTSLLAAAFFISSLLSIPVGPSSVHPMFGGMVGLLLGRRAPVAIFAGLLLQAVLFQHGGMTTLGANLLMISLPALVVYWLLKNWQGKRYFWKGITAGLLFTVMALIFLVTFLLFSSSLYSEGAFSTIQLLLIIHIPIVIVEAVLTGFVLSYLGKVRPQLVDASS